MLLVVIGGLGAEHDGQCRAVRLEPLDFPTVNAVVAQGAYDAFRLQLVLLVIDLQHVDGLADEAAGLVSEQVVESLVQEGDVQFRIDDDGGFRHLFQDVGVLVLVRLEFAPLADVAVDTAITAEDATLIEPRPATGFQDHLVPRLVQVGVDEQRKRFALFQVFSEQYLDPGGFPFRHQVERRFADHFLWAVTQKLVNLRAGIGVDSFGIDFPQPVEGRFDERLQALFLLFQQHEFTVRMQVVRCMLVAVNDVARRALGGLHG